MKLPRVPRNKNHYLIDLIRVLLAIHKDVYISNENIEIESYDSWDFIKVSVFRNSRSGPGCGNKAYRDQTWIKTKAAIEELFDMYNPPQYSWRWKSDSRYVGIEIETTEQGSIPGVCYWISKEPVVNSDKNTESVGC